MGTFSLWHWLVVLVVPIIVLAIIVTLLRTMFARPRHTRKELAELKERIKRLEDKP